MHKRTYDKETRWQEEEQKAKEIKKAILLHLDEMENIIKLLKEMTQRAEDLINKTDIQSHLFEIEHEIIGLETLVEGRK